MKEERRESEGTFKSALKLVNDEPSISNMCVSFYLKAAYDEIKGVRLAGQDWLSRTSELKINRSGSFCSSELHEIQSAGDEKTGKFH